MVEDKDSASARKRAKGQKEGETALFEKKRKLISHLTRYGLWLLIDPRSRAYQQIHPRRLIIMDDFIQIYNNTKHENLIRTLYLSEYGKTWFCTKKEADLYCNRFIQGEII